MKPAVRITLEALVKESEAQDVERAMNGLCAMGTLVGNAMFEVEFVHNAMNWGLNETPRWSWEKSVY